jgi:hypothetical protein
LSIVVRLADVSIARSELEAALNIALDRCEPDPRRETKAGSIGALSLDAALPFCDDLIAVSAVIPSPLAQLAGQIGIDIEISIYRTQSPNLTHH